MSLYEELEAQNQEGIRVRLEAQNQEPAHQLIPSLESISMYSTSTYQPNHFSPQLTKYTHTTITDFI